ncbi:DUF552 domain-containing protein [Sporolactobacillus sp. THM7-4]|nr:DUF552 domain-containing protein [Sporolactobacillus sp. THM7-4]
MGLKTKFRRFFDLEETVNPSEMEASPQSDDEPEGPSAKTQPAFERGGKIVALQNVHQQEKVVLVEPETFEEVEEIVSALKNKRTIICNLQRVTDGTGQRILDFVGGTVFALDGQIRKIGRDTYLFAPDFVDITGVISEWAGDHIRN